MKEKLITLIFFVFLLFSVFSAYSSTGKYALLIFGGHADIEAPFQDEPFVQY